MSPPLLRPWLVLILLLFSATAYAASSLTDSKKLDVLEPPFAEADFSWLNGANQQPSSLLTAGPVTFSLYADVYYAYQFHEPSDHTIFPTTTAPRHDEIDVNMAAIGVDLTGLDGPIGRVYLQYGNTVAVDAGQDPTLNRGYYLTHSTLDAIQQAAAGWHFHVLHGINFEVGIFPSYIGMESYLPQENWDYTHTFMSDFTPYYFSGSRTQIYFAQDLKLEIWIVNGWQTLGEWHESRAGGYLLNWRPTGRLSLTTSFYTGNDEQHDGGARRYYSDHVAEYKYLEGGEGSFARTGALSFVADYGFEARQTQGGGPMGGAALANHFTFNDRWANTQRLDFYYDKTQAVILPLPSGSPLPPGAFMGGGFTTTIDFTPSPWLIYRLEYSHRNASIPYFSGHGGISGGTSPPTPGATPDLAKEDDRLILNATLRL
jgi:hypothetical protein